ncbi:MAG: hypothetical protein ABIA37_01020 [Candidatus Woesearchaeota archaeon]
MNSEELEQNVINSFQLVKEDVRRLFENTKFILEQIEELRAENRQLRMGAGKDTTKVITVQAAKPSKTVRITKARQMKNFVASKTGKKVHSPNCLHAQNISKENKVIFTTKTKALNAGYKLCSCLAY